MPQQCKRAAHNWPILLNDVTIARAGCLERAAHLVRLKDHKHVILLDGLSHVDGPLDDGSLRNGITETRHVYLQRLQRHRRRVERACERNCPASLPHRTDPAPR